MDAGSQDFDVFENSDIVQVWIYIIIFVCHLLTPFLILVHMCTGGEGLARNRTYEYRTLRRARFE